MKKNKLIALTAAAVLTATAVVGGTLAYFTDTDEAVNTFTVGNVKIALHEANKEGKTDDDYQKWLKDQTLIPTTEAKVENTIDKIVTIENVGKNDAYVWAEIWVPAALDDGDDNSPEAPGLGNSLHFNYPAGVTATKSTYLGTRTIDGVPYNGYVHFRNEKVEAGYTSEALLTQVYMDAKVTQCTEEHGECYVLMDGTTHYTGDWKLIVNGCAIQADQFKDVKEAIEAYYGEDLTDHLWS